MKFKDLKDKKVFVYLLITFIVSIGVILTPLETLASERSINDEIFNDLIEDLFPSIPSWGWKLMDLSLTNASEYPHDAYVNIEQGRDYDKINRTIDKLAKGLRLYEYGSSGGEHGGGGHYREPSHLVIHEDPIIINQEPKVTVEPIIKTTYNNTTNNYDYSVFNPTINNFEIINNTYYNYDYDITIFQTDNYFIYYNYDITNYFITVAPISDYTNALYYVQYYELPDGRNSFNLTPNDIKGVIFNYDVINYGITPITEDIEVLGLYHFDGNNANVVELNNNYRNQHGHFVDGFFNGGYQFTDSLGYSSFFPFLATSNRYIMVSFWIYSPTVLASFNNITTIDTSDYYRFNYDVFRDGGWHYIQILFDTLNDTQNVSIDGGLFNYYNYSSYFKRFCTLRSNRYVEFFYPDLTADVGTKNINGVTAKPLFMYQSIIDELMVYTWNDSISFPFDLSFVPYQPFDFPFAYTVPDIPTITFNNLVRNNNEDIYCHVKPDGSQFGFYDYEFHKWDNYTDTVLEPYSLSPDGFRRKIHFQWYGIPHGDLVVVEHQGFSINGEQERIIGANADDYLLSHFGDGPFLFDLLFFIYADSDGVPYGYSYSLRVATLDETLNPTYVYYFYNNGIVLFDSSYRRDFEFYIYIWNYDFYDIETLVYSKSQCIAVQSPVPLNNTQIGGIRPFIPSDGDCFLSLFENRVTSCQVYYSGVWHNCEGAIFYKGFWYDVKYYDFSKLMLVVEDNNDSGGTTIINYFSSYSDNVNIIGSGNVSIDVDVTNFDKKSFTDVLTSIPKIFLTLGTTLLGMLTFLPTWLTVFIGTIFSCFVSLLIYLLVRRS